MSYIISVSTLIVILFFERNRMVLPLSAVIISGVVVFICLSGNYYNGYDWINYLDNFQCLKYLGVYCWDKYDISYTLIVYLCSKIFDDYHSVVVVISVINTYCLCFFAYKNCRNPLLFITIYFSLYAWVLYSETLRQSLAVSFVFLSLSAFNKKHFVKSLALLGVASTFHISALFFLVLYIIKYKTNLTYKLFVLSFLIGAVFLPYIAASFFYLNPRILSYFLDTNWNEAQNLSIIQVSTTLFSLLLLFMVWRRLYNNNMLITKDEWGKANLIMFSLFSVLFALGKLHAQYFEVLSRVNYYIAIPAFVYLSNRIEDLRVTNKIIIYPFLMVYLLYSPVRFFYSLQKFDEYNNFYVDKLLLNKKINIEYLKNTRCSYLGNKFSACK
ncbi:O87 family O-antigen polymerase [Escherichia coli]|nr:O87 family O-antigen polymerase [Escherichia coli]